MPCEFYVTFNWKNYSIDPRILELRHAMDSSKFNTIQRKSALVDMTHMTKGHQMTVLSEQSIMS